MEYEGTFVYIMQFRYTFQYLFPWNKEIYQNHIISNPSPWMKFLWFMGWLESPYTKDEEIQLMEVILSGAMTSIDALKKLEVEKELKENDRDGIPHAPVHKAQSKAHDLQHASAQKPIPNEV